MGVVVKLAVLVCGRIVNTTNDIVVGHTVETGVNIAAPLSALTHRAVFASTRRRAHGLHRTRHSAAARRVLAPRPNAADMNGGLVQYAQRSTAVLISRGSGRRPAGGRTIVAPFRQIHDHAPPKPPSTQFGWLRRLIPSEFLGYY